MLSKGADFYLHVQLESVRWVPIYALFHLSVIPETGIFLQKSCLKVQSCKAEHFSVRSSQRKVKNFCPALQDQAFGEQSELG